MRSPMRVPRVSLWCLIMSHTDVVGRAPGRLYLECETCGRVTPGWTVGQVPRPERARERRQSGVLGWLRA